MNYKIKQIQKSWKELCIWVFCYVRKIFVNLKIVYIATNQWRRSIETWHEFKCCYLMNWIWVFDNHAFINAEIKRFLWKKQLKFNSIVSKHFFAAFFYYCYFKLFEFTLFLFFSTKMRHSNIFKCVFAFFNCFQFICVYFLFLFIEREWNNWAHFFVWMRFLKFLKIVQFWFFFVFIELQWNFITHIDERFCFFDYFQKIVFIVFSLFLKICETFQCILMYVFVLFSIIKNDTKLFYFCCFATSMKNSIAFFLRLNFFNQHW